MANPLIRKLEHGVELTDDDCSVLSSLPHPRMLPARQDLVREGERCSIVHLILEGFACRYKVLPDGSTQITAILLPGDLCHPQAAVLTYTDHSIRTLSPAVVCDLSRDTIEALLDRPRIARALWWSSLVDEAILREWITNLGQRDSDKRLAHLLCEMLVRLQAAGIADDSSFPFPITQAELAEILGMTPVHVNRTLQQMRADGMVVLKGKKVQLPDVERLKAFCDFDPRYLHLQRTPSRQAEA